MRVKGGSYLCNEYLLWTLLQFWFYYMNVISEPFVEYIKYNFSNYTLFRWHLRICGYFLFPFISFYLYFVENISILLTEHRLYL